MRRPTGAPRTPFRRGDTYGPRRLSLDTNNPFLAGPGLRRVRSLALLAAALLFAGCIHASPAKPGLAATPAPATGDGAFPGESLAAPAEGVPAGWDPFEDAVKAGQPVQVEGTYTADNRTTRATVTFQYEGKLPHLTKGFALQLVPSEVATATWFEVDGKRVAAPLVHTYSGAVAGRPDDMARLTVTPHWVRGMVYDGDHAYDVVAGDFPVPEYIAGNGVLGHAGHTHSHSTPSAPAAQAGAPHSDPLQCLSDPLVGGERDPRTFQPKTRSGASKDPPLRAHLVLDGDVSLVRLMGNHTAAYLVAEAQELDLMFTHEAAVTMRLDGVALRTHALPDPANIWGSLKGQWDGRDQGRDLLLHFTSDIQTVTGASEAGQAYCTGAAGSPEFAYAFVGLDEATFNERGVRYIMGHETEHLFNTLHHDANNVETDACTLMALCAPASGLNFVFSSLERGFVRGWAEASLQSP
jgi:hypothetical protein